MPEVDELLEEMSARCALSRGDYHGSQMSGNPSPQAHANDLPPFVDRIPDESPLPEFEASSKAVQPFSEQEDPEHKAAVELINQKIKEKLSQELTEKTKQLEAL